MYRIFILSLLAIVSTTFALEPSQVILRATDIGSDSMALQWSPIEGAVSYKVLYDEETLINPNAPEPILESGTINKTEIVLPKMLEGTEYYLVVQGVDEKGENIGKTLPLHARTLRNPVFILKDARVVDDQHLELQFTHSVNLEKTQLEIVNTETKKPRVIKEITLSDEDLRVVHITLEGKMAPDTPHDIVLKKVTNVSGREMAPESRKNTAILFVSNTSGKLPEVTLGTLETTTMSTETESEKSLSDLVPTTVPLISEDDLVPLDLPIGNINDSSDQIDDEPTDFEGIPQDVEEKKTPVVIDSLPKTGPPFFMLFVLILIFAAYTTHKKYTSLV